MTLFSTARRSGAPRLAERFRHQQAWNAVLLGFVMVLGLFYARYVLVAGLDHDEVEHAHVAFRILNGEIPYRDFYQNHMPAYWLVSMPLVSVFPFSINAILVARGINLLLLFGCWVMGLRWLSGFRGGRTWLGIGIFSWVLITIAYRMDFHLARPDPLMSFLAMAGLSLIPFSGKIGTGRALLSGVLFGLSAAVSSKVMPIALVFPALLLVHSMRDRSMQPLSAIIPYVVGGILGLLPMLLWLGYNGLTQAFWFDVVELNRALSKPWYDSFNLFELTTYPAGLLGTLALLWNHLKRGRKDLNGPPVVVLSMLFGILLALILRHAAPYGFQLLMLPLAISFTSLTLYLGLRMRHVGYRVLLCVALMAYPAADMMKPLLASTVLGVVVGPDHLISHQEIQALMDLARPGNRTCTAFSPSHPIFCRDVSELSNSWDINFAESIQDNRQLDRFRKIWREGIHNTLEQKPDIILRKHPPDVWQRALNTGLITAEDLSALDNLKGNYRVFQAGRQEIWAKIDR